MLPPVGADASRDHGTPNCAAVRACLISDFPGQFHARPRVLPAASCRSDAVAITAPLNPCRRPAPSDRDLRRSHARPFEPRRETVPPSCRDAASRDHRFFHARPRIIQCRNRDARCACARSDVSRPVWSAPPAQRAASGEVDRRGHPAHVGARQASAPARAPAAAVLPRRRRRRRSRALLVPRTLAMPQSLPVVREEALASRRSWR